MKIEPDAVQKILANVEILPSRELAEKNYEELLKKKESGYVIYLETNENYPQLKILATPDSAYEVLENGVEHLEEKTFNLENPDKKKVIFAIHETYSTSRYHNYYYTMPLTEGNYNYLSTVLDAKNYKLLSDCLAKFRETVKKRETLSPEERSLLGKIHDGYDFQMEIVPYSIDELTTLQDTLLNVLNGLIFITDEKKFILNDFVYDEFCKTLEKGLKDNPKSLIVSEEDKEGRSYFEDIEARFNRQNNYIFQEKIKEKINEEREKNPVSPFSSLTTDVILCAVNAKKNNIFAPYEMPLSQCKNNSYSLQEKWLKKRIATDLECELTLPNESQVIKLAGGGDGDQKDWDTLYRKTSFSPFDEKRTAWQTGLYYHQKISDEIREKIDDDSIKICNTLVCLPYPQYQIIVLLHNLELTTDMNQKRTLLEKCLNIVEKNNLPTVPHKLIEFCKTMGKEIQMQDGGNMIYRANTLERKNNHYYDTILLQEIKKEALENAKTFVEQVIKLPNFQRTIAIYNPEIKSFETFTIDANSVKIIDFIKTMDSKNVDKFDTSELKKHNNDEKIQLKQ